MPIVQGCMGMLRAEAEPWEPIIIKNNSEDQEPKMKENSCTTKRIDDMKGWTTVNNITQMNHNNDEIKENKKHNEKIEQSNKHEKENRHYDFLHENSDNAEEEGSEDESGEWEWSNAKKKM